MTKQEHDTQKELTLYFYLNPYVSNDKRSREFPQ